VDKLNPVDPRPETDVQIFGANAALTHLTAMQAELDGVILGTDIECIHRMRVASRRLRNALNIFQDGFKKKEFDAWAGGIKHVTQSLGMARDTDIQIDLVEQFYARCVESKFHPGLRRLILRLSQKRQSLQRRVVKTMCKIKEEGLLDAMHNTISAHPQVQRGELPFSSDLYRLSFETIQQRLQTFLSYQEIIFDPEEINELHAMRIAAKWLRYSMETFAPLYAAGFKIPLKTSREAQEFLGQIHDCDMWIAFLPEFIQREKQRTLQYYGSGRPFYRLNPGIEFFLNDRQAERDRLYQEFLMLWGKWKNHHVWEDLEQTIHKPVIDIKSVFPPFAEYPPAEDMEP
jgi:CHAD domain-containing protein